MLHRALLKTHHMTSRKKIHAIAKAAKAFSCAVVLKTGRPPGVMIAECECANEDQEINRKARIQEGNQRVMGEGEERLRAWVSAVKMFTLLRKASRLDISEKVNSSLTIQQRLRYKDFQFLALERVPPRSATPSQLHQPHLRLHPHSHPRLQPDLQGRLSVPAGHVKELTEMNLFRAYLDECDISVWWTTRMGFSVPAER
ncbi:hypothetical protein MMC07_006181 [Pseudocyphellaria aurata]|nr:hypothetical protein [Pseudocyphellaria aurata]